MASASALARSGLVGHPSDGYGGVTLSVTLGNFRAEVEVEAAHAARLDIAPADGDQWPEGGQRLVAATVAQFAARCAACDAAFDANVSIRYRSTIPREVGLGGSSAIVIATLRALAQLADVAPDDDELPALALAVERRLGIVAGMQDRVVQTRGGLVFMDFERGQTEALDPALLPALLLAWRPAAGSPSGRAHAAVRARHDAGDRTVVTTMRALASLAREARRALLARDHDGFGAALDAGYDVRAQIFELDPRHTEMIDLARAHGLRATYTGSGGAIVAIAPDDGERKAAFAAALAPIGVHVVDADAQPADQASSSGSGSIG